MKKLLRLLRPDDPTTPKGEPQLCVGETVRLKRKPARVRRVLRTEWHVQRQIWTYIVETRRIHPHRFEPKFSRDELEVVP